MSYLRMENLDLGGKRVLIREDLNVPVSEGRVTSDARIRAALPTIQAALDKGAAVMVMSHLGRPSCLQMLGHHTMSRVDQLRYTRSSGPKQRSQLSAAAVNREEALKC